MCGCFQHVEELGKLSASTLVPSILKPAVVMSMAMGLGIFCIDITTACLHAFLNPADPPV